MKTIERILLQIGVILAFAAAGEWIAAILPVAVPPSIVAMALLLLLLFCGALRLERVEDTADFFLKNMGFFFIPVNVSIMKSYRLISDNLFKFLFLIVVTTLITFAATGWTVQAVMRLQNRTQKEEGQ
ncbi:MAG TPA: CidA/LrgA family protein [Candidatus Fimivivens faecavium]|nr:CidA/LrgA family protein [Candidatus Fimivivens faecavium]